METQVFDDAEGRALLVLVTHHGGMAAWSCCRCGAAGTGRSWLSAFGAGCAHAGVMHPDAVPAVGELLDQYGPEAESALRAMLDWR